MLYLLHFGVYGIKQRNESLLDGYFASLAGCQVDIYDLIFGVAKFDFLMRQP